jgi:hypothetical protein
MLKIIFFTVGVCGLLFKEKYSELLRIIIQNFKFSKVYQSQNKSIFRQNIEKSISIKTDGI